jgi:hypothetical protein
MSIEESFDPRAFFAGWKFEQPISRIAVGIVKTGGRDNTCGFEFG